MRNRLALTGLFLSAFALPAMAQSNRYSATTGDVSLTSAGATFTIQKPAVTGAQAKTPVLESITAYCSVACSVTQAYNGAAATATAGTTSPLPPNTGITATATVWTASNVGAGTAAGGIIHIAAGGTQVIDVSKVSVNGAGTAANYSVTVGSITGTVNFTFIWSEQQ